jgi:hypothetical protein
VWACVAALEKSERRLEQAQACRTLRNSEAAYTSAAAPVDSVRQCGLVEGVHGVVHLVGHGRLRELVVDTAVVGVSHQRHHQQFLHQRHHQRWKSERLEMVRGERCQEEGCTRLVVRGGTPGYCIAHGGGRRCQMEGCFKSARPGAQHCSAHGGGRRCQMEGCTTAARGASPFCKAHGGGRRCQMEGCTTAARDASPFCIAHGGGRRCTFTGCNRLASGAGSNHCGAHGGGCPHEGCLRNSANGMPHCQGHAMFNECKKRECKNRVVGVPGHTSCPTAMQKWRIVRSGFGTW